jgi:hypothetical protein
VGARAAKHNEAAFEWRGKNYVVSHSSVQLRIHTDEGIRVY